MKTKTILILLLFTQLSFSQISYDTIEVRPFLKSGKDFSKELKKALIIPDEVIETFQMINIEFVVSKTGEVISLKTNTNNDYFDRELLSIIKKLGVWSKPEHAGKEADCKININVKIK